MRSLHQPYFYAAQMPCVVGAEGPLSPLRYNPDYQIKMDGTVRIVCGFLWDT